MFKADHNDPGSTAQSHRKIGTKELLIIRVGCLKDVTMAAKVAKAEI